MHEFSAFVIEAEARLNSRTLTPLPLYFDLLLSTLEHFLIGGELTDITKALNILK